MTETARPHAASPFAEAAVVRKVGVDELSNVRHLHITAILRLAARHLSEVELEAFRGYAASTAYSERLADQARGGRLLGATLLAQLLATSGWSPANDSGVTARLLAVFVSPLYALNGIGRLMVGAAEQDARQAGFRVFTVRAPLGSIEFFASLGYDTVSHGVWPLPGNQPMPVAFMRRVAG